MIPQHQSLYAAYDLYPSTKGAATHINAFASTLFDFCGDGLLYVLGNEQLPSIQPESDYTIVRFSKQVHNYLDRAKQYTNFLAQIIQWQSSLKLIHFRDVWSGMAILNSAVQSPTLFEVNALPSIELPYHYQLSPPTLQKIRQLEDWCLHQSTHLVAPSLVIQQTLEKRGIPSDKITHIPNGAEILNQTPPAPDQAPERYIIYFGALQHWQGIDDLLKAFAGLQDLSDLHLVICSSNKRQTAKPFIKMAAKLGISDRIIWQFQLHKTALQAWISHALLSIAPLKACSRNLEQGCSPLKIFESMACKTAVVASDLPVVREIFAPDFPVKLVYPDRPHLLSQAIRFLLESPNIRENMALQSWQLLQNKYSWKAQKEKLVNIYYKLTHK